ncbi:MAG: cytochrome c biogenesis protein CcdA [Firmicutes bacterium]|jgi:cytochrome c-type biogenesis protein|nr:cytochrome c biogenesis protein CcdA [Bacillota bacterium]
MEQGNLSFMIAFFAGVVSFFSPCHLPLVPVYLGFLAGSVADAGGVTQKNRVLFNSLNFVVGFSAVFLLLGVLASWFAAFFAAYLSLLQRLAGGLIILFGLHLSGFLPLPLLLREKRLHYRPQAAGPGTSLVLGVAFAAGWTPCIGPVLGAILAYTAVSGGGVILLAAFSLGMAVPFLLAALLVEQLTRFVDRYVCYLPALQRGFGILLVLFGIAVFSGWLNRMTLIFS